MGAPLLRLAEGHPDELVFASSHVGFLPFPASLIELPLFFPNQLHKVTSWLRVGLWNRCYIQSSSDERPN